jgi:flagellar motor component MotA
VVGLIDILRQFSNLATIASGVGVAFTSTIYGLALANLALLPAAHRIRARAAETLELQELMAEGALCVFDAMHPRLVRQRLYAGRSNGGYRLSANLAFGDRPERPWAWKSSMNLIGCV